MKKNCLSVGIDIGTTTTQLVFSNIGIRRAQGILASGLSGAVSGEILYRSDIYFTPLMNGRKIDAQRLADIIKTEYRNFGVSPAGIDLGAVIVTGDTAKKENSAEVLAAVSGMAGDFVVETAGPDLEALLAGKGSGAEEMSLEMGGRILNMDIGGGTTNAAVFYNGIALDCFAAEIGGRGLKLKENGEVTHISDHLTPLIKALGLPLREGRAAGYESLERLATELAEMLAGMTGTIPLKKDAGALFIGHPFKGLKADMVTLSGGVAEFAYGREVIDTLEKTVVYGDIGPLLGFCISRVFREQGIRLKEPREKIRATVVGAGSRSAAFSGNTIYYDSPGGPLKNIPVWKLFGQSETEDTGRIRERIAEGRAVFPGRTLALAFRGPVSPGLPETRAIAAQIAEAAAGVPGPLIVLLESDFAKALGMLLKRILGRDRRIICLDGIRTEFGNYIDIGRNLSDTVPVVIKTLLFGHGK